MIVFLIVQDIYRYQYRYTSFFSKKKSK